MKRRNWFATLGAGLISAKPGASQSAESAGALPLTQFEPRSMLHVRETKVERARFPVIDIHTHLSAKSATPEELVAVMDRRNIRTMVHLTGGFGKSLEDAIAYLKKYPGRFFVFTEPMWKRAAEPGYSKLQADEIGRAAAAGAKGLKVLKTLGLYLRDGGDTGPLVKVDDRRFDLMWEAAAAHKLPVAIHTSDPEAFFLPIDRFNERWEELHAHPDWSFHGRDYPSNRELQEARVRMMKRHRKTQFICLHVANSEDLEWVSQMLDACPNMSVEIGARIGELGRQPRASRRFFDRYQDRILFGTDAIPRGDRYPQQVFGDELYRIYYRFLETEDEYFDYAPARVPPQGRWRIYGLGLPEAVLRKVYSENAARLLGL